MSDLTPAMQQMMRERATGHVETDERLGEKECLAQLAEIDRIAPFLDAAWAGGCLKPSEHAAIILCMKSTALYGVAMPWGTVPTAPTAAVAKALADEFAAWVLHEARQRYRAGFYADPFANNPVPRSKDEAS